MGCHGDPAARPCTGVWTRFRVYLALLSSEHMDSVLSMFVDEDGLYGVGSDHNWIELLIVDKFAGLAKVDKQPKKKKDIWNIKDDQNWTVFKEEVEKCLPPGDYSHYSVNDLAAMVATALRNAGQCTIGYKRHFVKTSMTSRSLPAHILKALDLKRDLCGRWKSQLQLVLPPKKLLLLLRLLSLTRLQLLMACLAASSQLKELTSGRGVSLRLKG